MCNEDMKAMRVYGSVFTFRVDTSRYDAISYRHLEPPRTPFSSGNRLSRSNLTIVTAGSLLKVVGALEFTRWVILYRRLLDRTLYSRAWDNGSSSTVIRTATHRTCAACCT